MHKKPRVLLVMAVVALTGLISVVWSERRGKARPKRQISVKVMSEPPEIPTSPYMKEFGRKVEERLKIWTDSQQPLPCLELIFVSLYEGRDKVILMTIWDCEAQVGGTMTLIQTSQDPQGAARLALAKLLEFLKRRGPPKPPQTPWTARLGCRPCGLFASNKKTP